MTELETLVQIHDVDLLLEQLRDASIPERAGEGGVPAGAPALVQRARARLTASLDRRWVTLYERALRRYGRGMIAVRDRVCQGCHLTLPTAAQPLPGLPMICEGCGRLLYWPASSD